MTSENMILTLYQAGYSQQSIKQHLQVPLEEIGRVLRGAGQSTRTYHHMQPELSHVLYILMEQNVFYRDVEAYCDISAAAARDWVARRGMNRTGKSRTYQDASDELNFPEFRDFVRLYLAGESFPALICDLRIPDDKVYSLFWYVWHEDLSAQHHAALVARIRSLLRDGHPASAVAHQLRISPSIVRDIARAGG